MSIQSLKRAQRDCGSPLDANGNIVERHHAGSIITHEQSDARTSLNSRSIPMGRDQNSEAERSRENGRAIKFPRLLWRVIGIGIRHLLVAIHESRRKQAMLVIGRNADLIAIKAGDRASNSRKPLEPIRDASMTTPRANEVMKDPKYAMTRRQRVNCPVTASPCEGDLAYLCHDWGCARKGGFSPVSHENL